jgi:hypothetical protein
VRASLHFLSTALFSNCSKGVTFHKPEFVINEDKDKPKEAPDTTNGDPAQRKSDPQLTELDGLKKGGVQPTVHREDKPLDEEGKRED